MKKLLFTILLACIGSAAIAQTSQGNVVVSGTVGYQNHTQQNEDKTSTYDSRSFIIAPGIGYILKDGLEAGISFRLSSSLSESNSYYLNENGRGELYSMNESKDKSFAISPYLKKYFYLTDKIAFTGEAYISFSKGDSRYHYEHVNHSSTDSKRSNTGFGVGLRPGITFFPTEKIGLSTNFGRLGYNHTTYKNAEYDYKSKSSDFGLDLDGNTLTLGFGYYISR